MKSNNYIKLMSGKKLLVSFLLVFLGLFNQSGKAQCNAIFIYYPDSTGYNVQFQDSSYYGGQPVSWAWDFGDGWTSNQQFPTHLFNMNGYARVCLTVVYSGGCTATVCDSVFIGPPSCQASFLAGPLLGTMVVNFSNTSSGASPVSYSWDFGDGSPLSNAVNPSHTYATPGTYTVCLSIQSASGCTSTTCSNVLAGAGTSCTASFIASGVPSSNLISFTDNSTAADPIVSYFWDFGDNNTSQLASPQHTYSLNGLYIVCLTIQTSTGCSDTQCDSVYITSGSGCQAYFTSSPSGGGILFQNLSVPNNGTSTWDFGDGNVATTSGNQNIFHTYASSGYFRVCLTVSDSSCSDTYCDSVGVNTFPGCTAQFYSTPDTTGYELTFNNISFGQATNWLWTFGDGTSSTLQNPVHTYSAYGSYTVCLYISNPGTNCADSTCQVIDVQNPCTPRIIAVPDSMNPANVNMLFYAVNNCGNVSSVFWDFGDGTYDSTGTFAPGHTYAISGWYQVTVCIVIGTDTICESENVYAYRVGSGINIISEDKGVSVFPNPFSATAKIRYHLSVAGDLHIGILDLAGKEVRTVFQGIQNAGDQELMMNASGISPGIYFLNMATSQQRVVIKLVVQQY